jgi:predicted dehydrogenase
VNIGILGLGFMGATHLAACSKVDGLEVTAVSTRDLKTLSGDLSHIGGNLVRERSFPDFSAAAKYTDWRELIDDPSVDAVDICLPTDLHEGAAVAALDAGKHVLCEKPMALTNGGCERMLRAAEAHDRILTIGHVLRFWPAYVYLRKFVSSGEYGKIRSATFVRQCGVPDWSSWLPVADRSGGAILDLLIHDVDQALALFGRPQGVRAKSLGEGDTVAATLIREGGPEVRIQGGWFAAGTPFSMSFQVQAERAQLDYSQVGLVLSDQSGRRDVIEPGDDDPYALQLSYFADCCQSSRQPELCAPQDAAAAVEVALLLKESRARNGELIACEA